MAAHATDGLEFLDWPYSREVALAALTDPIRRWFLYHFNEPTTAQRISWPTLAAGKNLLLSAPTGTGKSLAAFLPLLSRLIVEETRASVRLLYLAPLKALANDALRNLKRYRDTMPACLPHSPRLPRMGLRTGDTSARARRDLRVHPPDILLTTPESLAVMLSQPDAATYFAELRAVVVDELHALAPNKRGADLALSLERLEQLVSAPLQRIGLSATCHPLAEVARFLTGVGRSCTVATVGNQSPLQLSVEPLADSGTSCGFLGALVERLRPELVANQSLLIFANTRAVTERLGWALRQRFPEWDDRIAVHHSALSANRRREVEAGLKQGLWKAVVTSTSLELGIDIGSVEEVVLIHPPGDVVRLLQRIGRSGHAPGKPRRGLVLTANTGELLEAAVTGASGLATQCERLRVPNHPLDMLCQQLLGMAAERAWAPDEAYLLVRRAYPYRHLAREDFDACLTYLLGQHRDGRTWLPPRLRWQADTFTILDRRTAKLLRRNLGSILTEEPRRVRRRETAAVTPKRPILGYVDELFADRLQAGDRFLLDGRCLEFRRSDGGDVLVDEVAGRPVTPRWGGAGWPLSPELARRLFLLRTQAAEALRHGPSVLVDLLRQEYGLRGSAVTVAAEHFQRQECVSEIPDGTTLLIEAVSTETGIDYYFHTPLNRSGNDALARVVALRLARDQGVASRSLVADLGFGLFLDTP
ncbi:MAG TPA: DEAD/DEAH box helicase, partial [Gemmataceae bacterium]